MSETFDDLRRLREMLDADEVTPEEYEVVKAGLLANASAPSQREADRVGPGWYPDPEDAKQQRYWDGSVWTESRQTETGVAMSSKAIARKRNPNLRRNWFIGAAVLGGGTLVMAVTTDPYGSRLVSFVITLFGLTVWGAIGFAIYRASQNDHDVEAVVQLPPSVHVAVSQMPPTNQAAFFAEFNEKRRKKWIGYIALITLGWHYLYVGRVGVQFAFWLTVGGYFVWWFVDLFRMEAIIGRANDEIARQALQTLAVGHHFAGYPGAPPPPPQSPT